MIHHNNKRLGTKFSDISLHNRLSNHKSPCRLAHGLPGTASNGISQAVTFHNSLSPLPARLLTLSLSPMRFLIAETVGRDTPMKFTTSLTLCTAQRVARTFTQLSLCGVILKYATITNFSVRCHGHRASCGLNKIQIITAKQLEF